MPLALAKEEIYATQELQNKGIIRPSSSPWASPLVLVKKEKWGNKSMCRIQRTNKVTTKDAFP